MLTREDTLQFSRDYSFSIATIKKIMAFLACKTHLSGENLKRVIKEYLNLLKVPQKYYSIRLNLLNNSLIL